MENEKYIEYFCYQGPQKQYNYKGDYLGMSDECAIFYDRKVGRHRNYRQTYPVPLYNGLVLKTFKSKKYAQELCDYTNEQFGSNYIVKEIVKWKTKKK